MAAAVAAAVAVAIREAIPHENPLETIQIINEIGKGRLEVMKVESQLELERLKMDGADKKERREEERSNRAKMAAQKAAESVRMKALRAEQITARRQRGRGGAPGHPVTLDAEMANCEECRSKIEARKAAHTFDMLRHAEQRHELALKQAMDESLNGTPN